MPEEETDSWSLPLIILMILITGKVVAGDSLESDKEVLLELKSFLEIRNQVNQGRYSEWNKQNPNPCFWPGVICRGERVTGINLTNSLIAGELFNNFSGLTQLSYIDLSKNTIEGGIPDDLNSCLGLKHLNLSHNILDGDLNLSRLSNLEVLDLTLNRIRGEIRSSLPENCSSLVVANVSMNNFTGRIDDYFDKCSNLKYLDLSTNNFNGEIWSGFSRLVEFSVAENFVHGVISGSDIGQDCRLQVFDLSENNIMGEFPRTISNCKNLFILNAWGNNFTGKIPMELGSISSLGGLFLGNNSFDRNIPETLLNLSNLEFLDLSKNKFGGEIQEIFGRFTQLKFLVLHGNSYTDGIQSSGILKLPNLERLDLSYNQFSGPLPNELSGLTSLEFLVLAYNQFTGPIPLEYGNLSRLQAIDLSFNQLNGSVPTSFGKLRSLLWLMLANNSLTGEIPPELGNCSSLLWMNLANNQLSGNIPSEITNIGRNATQTFALNQKSDKIIAGSGECLAMKRWIPANYPPFSFVYTILTRKSCRTIWDRLLKGFGIFPVCSSGSPVRTFTISGYLQLSGNQLSGEIPIDIGKMENVSMLHLGSNRLTGKLPKQIGMLPLVVLNLTRNNFSGEIPTEVGDLKCMQNLDFARNNFSGNFPASLNNLTELNKFNISYNPFITGVIPSTGQLATFEKDSYLGVPLLKLPSFIYNVSAPPESSKPNPKPERRKFVVFLVFMALVLGLLVCGVVLLSVCIMVKSPTDHTPGYLLEDTKYHQHYAASSSGNSSPWSSSMVKVIRLDKTAFTHADILKATNKFSDTRIIGTGGSGTVYRGTLPDGREVAVKKLQREGIEGEREFRAEMEVLTGNGGFGWPHPNLVTLYGWCLDGSDKILVYEYMNGGSLEELILDRVRLGWRKRINVAIDVARALVFLHQECFPAIVHRDVKASNVLLDKDGRARVTDFGLARVVDAGDSHVSTMVAGTVGYVAPEYGQTWQATTKGDVYSYGVLIMELATGRRAIDGGEECLVEWSRRITRNGRNGLGRVVIPVALLGSGVADGADELCELLRIGVKCTAETPSARPNMKEVLEMLVKISGFKQDFSG